MDALPIDEALPALRDALGRAGRAVLQAPPGAGKTTRVPLALLPDTPGRIVMLEPRRLAARAAAERMAASLGEPLGRTVGYRIRGEARTSPATRIEVVTEGILTRMLQSDPDLPGIGTLIFDEFHERSLNADLGLALAWEVRAALRPDLRLLVMSATLDAAPVAAMLDDAPVITSQGRAFPVETRWLPRPTGDRRFEQAMADLIATALAETEGGLLAFLPGEGEIRRTAAALAPRLPEATRILPLFGAMDLAAQRAAIAPAPGVRKVVLATAIAETSLTIEDIRVVVDGGRARRARFDPGSGMSRLVTERVTRAEADQRRGRAGRVAPGTCYRMWTRGEEGALAAYPPPEIAAGDLTGLALDLALWGTPTGQGLAFLTPPNPAALAEARALLAGLGALDDHGHITPHGKALAAIPAHPRLAHMLATAGPDAAPLAALLADRDPLRGAPADITLRLAALANPARFAADHPFEANRGTLERLREEARRLARLAGDGGVATRGGPLSGGQAGKGQAGTGQVGTGQAGTGAASGKPLTANPIGAETSRGGPFSPGEMAALAYPDRIAARRKGEAPRFVLSGGKGAVLDPSDPLARAPLLVATDLDGDPREARIRLAAPLTDAGLRRIHGHRIAWHDTAEWSRRDGRVVARREERLGAAVLAERPWPEAPAEALARAALDGLRDEIRQGNGLPLTAAAQRLRDRAAQARAAGEDIPPVDDESLMAAAEDWLLPHLGGLRTRADLRALDLADPLRQYLGGSACARLDALYPSHFITPLGRRVPIDYAGEAPALELRLQELFGQTTHPTTGPERRPIRLTLLSPGHKPIAVTSDLPGFWAGAYGEVRKDMRGRYPRHPWPEDPTAADPTLRAKPRGT